MPLALSLGKGVIEAKITNGPLWSRELALLKEIKGAKFNGNKKVWEIPNYQIEDIITRWEMHELFFPDPAAEDLIVDYWVSRSKLDELPSIKDEFTFSKPLTPYQDRYVRINRAKTRLLCAFEQGLGKTLASLERLRILGYTRSFDCLS